MKLEPEGSPSLRYLQEARRKWRCARSGPYSVDPFANNVGSAR